MPRKKTKSTFRAPRVSADTTFSYKDAPLLAKFVTEQGYIVGRSKTGLSQKQQRQLARAIKRARHLAMLPYTQTV
jgi:small subunit ribosomal protein S18